MSWPIYALYAAGILFPFTYVLATFGNRLFAEIAFIVPVFYVINVGIAYRLNRVFNSGYRLRHAYGKLTEDYSALNQRLEQQLVELDEARRQVEASGRKLALFAERSPIAVFEFDAHGTDPQRQPGGRDPVRLRRGRADRPRRHRHPVSRVEQERHQRALGRPDPQARAALRPARPRPRAATASKSPASGA